jgi:hypothetical protein
MKKSIIIATTLLSLNSLAVENFNGKVSLTLSTMGAGVEYTQPVNDSFAVRVGVSGLSVESTAVESDIEYTTTLEMKNTHFLADYHLGGSIFRMSAGAFNMDNTLKLSGILPPGTIQIGTQTINVSDIGSLDGAFSFKGTVPYAGLGLAQSPSSDSSLGMSIDIGVVKAPSIKGSLEFVCASTITAVCDNIATEVATENVQLQAEFDKQAEDLKFLPVISAGISYKF